MFPRSRRSAVPWASAKTGRVLGSRTRTSTRGLGRLGALVAAVLAASWTAVPARAEPNREAARRHYQAGAQLFAAGDYRGAIGEFKRAQALAPAPVLHFNLGLAHERLGEPAAALQHYRTYLRELPGADNRVAVEAKIQRLEAELPAAQELPPGLERAPPPLPLEQEGGVREQSPAAGASPEPAEAPAPATPRTGDPELDRVAELDITALREARGLTGDADPSARVRPGLEPPTRPPTAPPPGDGFAEPPNEPIYKRWWFWVVVGVSAVILLEIASSETAASNPATAPPASPAAPVIFRF